MMANGKHLHKKAVSETDGSSRQKPTFYRRAWQTTKKTAKIITLAAAMTIYSIIGAKQTKAQNLSVKLVSQTETVDADFSTVMRNGYVGFFNWQDSTGERHSFSVDIHRQLMAVTDKDSASVVKLEENSSEFLGKEIVKGELVLFLKKGMIGVKPSNKDEGIIRCNVASNNVNSKQADFENGVSLEVTPKEVLIFHTQIQDPIRLLVSDILGDGFGDLENPKIEADAKNPNEKYIYSDGKPVIVIHADAKGSEKFIEPYDKDAIGLR